MAKSGLILEDDARTVAKLLKNQIQAINKECDEGVPVAPQTEVMQNTEAIVTDTINLCIEDNDDSKSHLEFKLIGLPEQNNGGVDKLTQNQMSEHYDGNGKSPTLFLELNSAHYYHM
ncbi:uncharacterized protein LOC113376157 [Ctenocephalides felis]|uniref:uncharacterized protein LOC113376157 n=1 Tax=Ctenocephalides felis TaxID=7515 RepID=UPI000E6E5963|nr:uncharacterized protein LOC113376157 [Ctenocephalides felis]